jgi:hypothetical protein
VTTRAERRSLLVQMLLSAKKINYRPTIYDLASALGCSVNTAQVAVHDLRNRLDAEKYRGINLVCEPDPGNSRAPHEYRLISTLDDARPWLLGRFGYIETSLQTVVAVSNSIAFGAPKGTTYEMTAQMLRRQALRSVEDLQDARRFLV